MSGIDQRRPSIRAVASSRPEWRAGRRLAAVGLALVLVGCGGSGPASTSAPAASALTSSPTAPPPTEPPVAGSFADLPFSLDLPADWVFGTQQQVEANLRSLAQSNTADAKRIQALLAQVPPATSSFVAYEVGSKDSFTPNISCQTTDLGSITAADALNLGETQNSEAIAGMPGIVGKPVADRVVLPIGETVRIRWRTTALGADTTSIGYMFVAGPTVYTCVFTAATSAVAAHQPDWEAILGTFHAKGSAAASGTATSPTPSGCPATVPAPHEAPEIEALLPGIVQGRPLIRWSIRGECWLELAVSDPGARQQIVSSATTAANPNPVDPAQLVYGVAGRSDTKEDPPSFVFAAFRPQQNDEIDLAMALLFGGAGYKDFAAGVDLRNYQEQTIGGKQVYVGTPTMVDQSEHQRGRPYLYQTDTHMFVVVTDSDTWASEAITQLP